MSTTIDLELGNVGGRHRTPPAQMPPHRVSSFLSHIYKTIARYWKKKIWTRARSVKNHWKIEDFRQGYPQFTALMASHGSFHIFRRFEQLRVRLLLLEQDKLSLLEKELARIDQEESSPLFLACSRMDRCEKRAKALSQIQEALVRYDDLLERSRRVLSFDTPISTHVSSLDNWLEGNGCIARGETQFLDYEDDLLSVAPLEDGILYWLDSIVTATLAYFSEGKLYNRSNDPHVHLYDPAFTNRAARVLVTPLVTSLLIAPVFICNLIESAKGRLTVLFLAAIIFITVLSLLTKSRTIDLATSGATYLAVLVVFITGQ